MNEKLTGLNREQVQSNLQRVTPEFSVSQSIADELSLTVFDQPEASLAVGRRLAMWQRGLTNPNKPIGSMLFIGPPGSGKTEMAKAVSTYFFNDKNSPRLIRLPMSDYGEAHTSARITGSPNGYVGYNEGSVIPHDIVNDKKAPSIVLLDEIEKAHPAVVKVFLEALDNGRIMARNGQKGMEAVDLTRTLFIMTSNVASEKVIAIEKGQKRSIGFGLDNKDTRADDTQRVIKEALKSSFVPEFLDRITETVVFKPVDSPETRSSILTKFLGEQNEQFKDRYGVDSPYLALTQEAREHILSLTGDKGGRGIQRAFDSLIVSTLPDVMLGMDIKRRPFVADIEDGKTVWYTDVRRPEVDEVHIGNKLQLTEGKKNEPTPDNLEDGQGDRFSVAGGDSEPPSQEEEAPENNEPWTEEEEELTHYKKIEKPRFRLFLPKSGDVYSTIDLAITVHEKGKKDKIQLLEGIPLLEQK